VIHFLKEHPWRSGALAAVVVLAGALAVVMYVRRDGNRAQTAAEHAGHAAPAPAGGASERAAGEHAGHGAATAPEGFAPVALEPAQATAMGLTTQVVGERDFSRKLRTVGVVTLDETRTAHVHARVRGWIEGFHVQYVGRKVRKGEPLVSLYSQEVYAAQLELASIARAPVKSPELLDAARKRLALWEVPRSLVEQVEATGEPQRTFPVLSPRAGVVIAKQAFDGLFIDPSIELYTISDLSRVWVLADIYDTEVAHVTAGSVARLTIEGQAAPVTSKVAFLYPTIDERTRTRKARFELTTRDGTLLPGAFVTVELELAMGRGLAIPESAVIRTGARAIVFVVHGEHAEPREIKLGSLVGDHYRVEGGLAAGEHVATGAQFLLDSESRLRATSAPGGAHAGH
jgi:Cu(I)/Ag(I) efflux system membrane fusion protein